MARVLLTIMSRLTRFSATITPMSALCESVRICSCEAMTLAYCGVVRFVAHVLLGAQQFEWVKMSRPEIHMTPFDMAGAQVDEAWNSMEPAATTVMNVLIAPLLYHWPSMRTVDPLWSLWIVKT